MPVKPCIRILENGGWKKEQNSRFGAVVVGVLETYDPEGNMKVFHFAPTLEDLPILEELIKVTREVDEHNKAIKKLKERVELLEVVKGLC